MKRKIVALVLLVSMLLCVFTGCANNKATGTTNVTLDGYDITVQETADTRTASTTIEGVPIRCERNLKTEEYWLYVNDADPMQLEVEMVEENIITVSEVNATSSFADDEVVGQFALTLSLATPALIAAAKALICTVACVAVTSAVYVSADAIGNVIGGVRSYSSTYRSYTKVDVDAADAIRYGRLSKSNAYYAAYLSNNRVYIGQKLSEWSAVSRLECGYDVFATTAYAAAWACAKASTCSGTPTHHQSSGEGYYPHYHPLGRHWAYNYRYAPHCWYPY